MNFRLTVMMGATVLVSENAAEILSITRANAVNALVKVRFARRHGVAAEFTYDSARQHLVIATDHS